MVQRFWSYWIVILLGIAFYGVRVLEANGKKILEARKKINTFKSIAVRSIQSEDGDIIDCIDIYKQPAFDHPALKNHTIQMEPSSDPTIEPTTKTRTGKSSNLPLTVTSQVWQKNGSCPKGTIPVRRIQEKELLKADSVEDYGKKKPSFQKTPNLRETNRSMAILLTEGYSYSGVKGDIKVWNPFVESDDEYSISQVSLKSGPWYSFESVQSGWAVNPSVYGDRQTRLFVYWTADAYKTTGCFDLTCPGFVQTSNEVALGAAIYPISVSFGLPYQITMYIHKDPVTNNWWVEYGDKIYLGYWPPALFTLLHGNAQGAEWGGEVYSQKLGHPPHTKTNMGNGRFPDGIFGNSGAVTRLRVRENTPLKFPEWVSTYADEYDCYQTYYQSDYMDEPEFYFGGPGQNPLCP